MQKKIIIFILIVIVVALVLTIAILNGMIRFNNPSIKDFPVRGVDVSSYQGNIDWEILSKQNISFAFIKATEGSSFVDEYFKYNWESANKTELKVGAYHFFSYDSSGETQGNNFINTVPISEKSLPPVVDIEFYGDYYKNEPSKNDSQRELTVLLEKLEKHYCKKPIIYATQKSYNLYIKDSYQDYPIWIRDVLTKPKLSDNRTWTFWQYTDKEKLDGYSGKERFIDMNVFNGSNEEFMKFDKGV